MYSTRSASMKQTDRKPRTNTMKISISDNAINAKTVPLAERVVLALSAISTVFTIGWVFWYCQYGIDFTDEGYYLAWISNPDKYAVSATQFGFIYHPLYELLDGNIAAFRQANMLITFCLSWALSNAFLKSIFGIRSLERTPRLIISAAIATTAAATLVFAGMWLSTPGYNSLTLQALLVAAIGLILADKQGTRESIFGWFLIGIGGWLTFMAKPTSAAALALCASIYFPFAGKFSLRLLMIPIATSACLVLLSALAIDGSIIAFFERLRNGADVYRILGGGIHDRLLRIDDVFLGKEGTDALALGVAVFFLATCLSQAKSKLLVQSGNIMSIAIALASITIISGHTKQVQYVGTFQGLLIVAVPLAAIMAGLLIFSFKELFQIPRPHWILGLTFLMIPYAYAFGSGSNYWVLAANAGIFWVLAGLVLLSPAGINQRTVTLLRPLGLAVQLVAVALVQAGIEAPYRQPQPLRYNDSEIEIGKPGSTLVLSQSFGQYFAETITVAKQAGFKTRTPMIDLSGRSLGILYGLNAINTGLAWGGYPGSDQLVIVLLKKVSCEDLAIAWLLVEPEGPARISPEILLSFGANLTTDYKVVGSFKTAEGAGGYKEAQAQQLFKPVRSVSTAAGACEAVRAIKP